jgi:hypothetical protein
VSGNKHCLSARRSSPLDQPRPWQRLAFFYRCVLDRLGPSFGSLGVGSNWPGPGLSRNDLTLRTIQLKVRCAFPSRKYLRCIFTGKHTTHTRSYRGLTRALARRTSRDQPTANTSGCGSSATVPRPAGRVRTCASPRCLGDLSCRRVQTVVPRLSQCGRNTGRSGYS